MAAGWSAFGGVLDFRAGLLHVALYPVTAALGAQAPAAGEPADAPLDAAFNRFGLVRELPGHTHGELPFVESSCRGGRAGRDVGDGRALTCQRFRICDAGLRGSGSASE